MQPAMQGHIAPKGRVKLSVVRPYHKREARLTDILRHAMPSRKLPRHIAMWRLKNLHNLWRGLWRVLVARLFKLQHIYGTLYLTVLRADGTIEPYGLASMRVVTDDGVDFIVDAFQNTTEVENLKFHGIGTGTNAEAQTDSALQTELTTQYTTDNTRATGSTTEGGSTNIYRTVGTNAVDATVAITEHGILDQAATGGGTLLDRSVFTVINLSSGDSLQSTYDLTFPANG